MRETILFVLILYGCVAFGQNKQLLYNFNSISQSLMNNPATEPDFDMHIGVPFLSGAHISAGSSGVNLYDIFQEGNGNINDRIRSSIAAMTSRDFFNVNQQFEILSVGWRDGHDRYFSAGIYQESDAFVYFPKDLAILAFEGNENYRNKAFDFSDMALTAEVLSVFHFGLSQAHSRDLTYGFRGKIYSGALNIQSVKNQGTFETISTPGSRGTYRPVLNEAEVLVNTAGLASLTDSDNTGNMAAKKMAGRMLLGGNLGLGVDFGFTYYLQEQWRVTGSLLDLGLMYNFKDVENHRYSGNFRGEGVELDFFEPREEPIDNLDELRNDLEDYYDEEIFYDSYFSLRPVKLNASIDYGFSEDLADCDYRKPSGRRKYNNYVGFQLFSMKRPRSLVNAATVFYEKKISPALRGKITYTVDPYSYSNIGLLLSTRIRNFNFYLAGDNILSYRNLAKANNASVQFGFQFILNKG